VTTSLVPLKYVAVLNPEALPEDTSPHRAFRYIDIANTGRGKLHDPPAPMTFASAPSRARRVLRTGDTILSTVRTYLRAVWTVRVPDNDLIASTGFVCVRPRPGIDARFLGWLLQSDSVVEEVVARSVGVSYPAVNPSDVGQIKVAVPRPITQRYFADYLDCETARIDALTAAKRRMIELLEERKDGLRERLVLESQQVGMAIRLGHLLREVDDRLGDRSPPPLLSVSIHHGVVPFAEANPDRAPRADDLINYKCCNADDIVLNRMRAFQGGVGRATMHGIVSPDYAVLRPLKGAAPAYLHHLLRSPWFIGEMEARLRGIGSSDQGNVRTPRVNWEDLRTVVVSAPPEEEQSRLAKQLDAYLGGVVAMQSTLDRQIELIEERRQALITAAVTGQLVIPVAA
jgi:type I restriction enzyme S subunit